MDDELWGLLNYYSEIRKKGLELFASQRLGLRARNLAFERFRARIRQARTYYVSARALDYRSKALLYYYCFLNLVEAFLLTEDARRGGSRGAIHGLSYRGNSPKDFKRQAVRIHGPRGGHRSVFHDLFSAEAGLELRSGQRLRISDLTLYCTDIAWDVTSLGLGMPRTWGCRHSFAFDEPADAAWNVIAIPRAFMQELSPRSRYGKQIRTVFQECDLDAALAREILGIEAWHLSAYAILQDRQPANYGTSDSELTSRLTNAFHGLIAANFTSSPDAFYVHLPMQAGSLIPMSEFMAIYAVMFYLSSLVRYRPELLEYYLNSGEALLVETLVRSAAITFLRQITGRVLKTNYVLTARL